MFVPQELPAELLLAKGANNFVVFVKLSVIDVVIVMILPHVSSKAPSCTIDFKAK